MIIAKTRGGFVKKKKLRSYRPARRSLQFASSRQVVVCLGCSPRSVIFLLNFSLSLSVHLIWGVFICWWYGIVSISLLLPYYITTYYVLSVRDFVYICTLYFLLIDTCMNTVLVILLHATSHCQCAGSVQSIRWRHGIFDRCTWYCCLSAKLSSRRYYGVLGIWPILRCLTVLC